MKKKMFFLSYLLILSLSAVLLTGCKKELPNPETLDPIYKDLIAEYKNYEKLLKDEEKNLASLLEEKKNFKARTIDIAVNKKDVSASKRKIINYRQKSQYYKIRAERRRLEARKAYKIAFKKDEHWPDPKEYEKYKTYMRLRNSPLNWSKRVPKLFRESPNFKEDKAAQKKTED